jgi:hypothetical protein
MVIGTEHALEEGVEINLADMPLRRHTTALHVAGPDHSLPNTRSGPLSELLGRIAQTSFSHPIEAVLDLHPATLKEQTEFGRQFLIYSARNDMLWTQRK